MSPNQIKLRNLLSAYFIIKYSVNFDRTDPSHVGLFKRFTREAKTLMAMSADDEQRAIDKIKEIKVWGDANRLSWNLSTVVKRFLEDNKPPKPVIHTNEKWKDYLEPRRDDSAPVINEGLQGIKEMLRKKGLRGGVDK